ncbi:hypothetical protein J6590_052333 [Homalodisca vitripennis]|nr:hypothetical protein J6590_052333 [Homalodisca vitripennis]
MQEVRIKNNGVLGAAMRSAMEGRRTHHALRGLMKPKVRNGLGLSQEQHSSDHLRAALHRLNVPRPSVRHVFQFKAVTRSLLFQGANRATRSKAGPNDFSE